MEQRELTQAQVENLQKKKDKIDLSTKVQVDCLSEKEIEIAELLVKQKHPLSKINLSEALPILRYLPSCLVKKNGADDDY